MTGSEKFISSNAGGLHSELVLRGRSCIARPETFLPSDTGERPSPDAEGLDCEIVGVRLCSDTGEWPVLRYRSFALRDRRQSSLPKPEALMPMPEHFVSSDAGDGASVRERRLQLRYRRWNFAPMPEKDLRFETADEPLLQN